MSILIPKIFSMLFCSLLVFMQPSCQQDSYWLKVSAPVTIGEEWVELQPESPLKADKNFQWVFLDLEPPLKDDMYHRGRGTDSGDGILMPDGETINPEIEVIDQYGNKFNFVYRGARRGLPIYGFSDPAKLPRDREYKSIRIRSPRPLKCKAVYWFCESIKDWD